MKKSLILGGIAAFMFIGVAGAAFALLVWPTPYRYEQITNADGSSTMVRFRRSDGQSERFSSGQWKPMRKSGGLSPVSCEEARAAYRQDPYYGPMFFPPPAGCELASVK